MNDYASLTPSIDSPPQPDSTPGQIFARLSRAAGIMLVVVVPIVVSPWGSDGYNQVKALAAETLAAVAVIGWGGAALTAGRPSWGVTPAGLPLLAVLLAVLLLSATSLDPPPSLFRAPRPYVRLVVLCARICP